MEKEYPQRVLISRDSFPGLASFRDDSVLLGEGPEGSSRGLLEQTEPLRHL